MRSDLIAGGKKGQRVATSLPLLDEAHLARQTFGDPVLAREVLGLFVQQLERLGSQLKAAEGAARGALLHSLKGSARAVGATALAQLAEQLEGEGADAAGADALPAMLSATLRAVSAHMS